MRTSSLSSSGWSGGETENPKSTEQSLSTSKGHRFSQRILNTRGSVSLTEMAPGDVGRRSSADLAVEAGVAALDHFQHVQLAGEEWLDGRNDFEFGAGGQLL